MLILQCTFLLELDFLCSLLSAKEGLSLYVSVNKDCFYLFLCFYSSIFVVCHCHCNQLTQGRAVSHVTSVAAGKEPCCNTRLVNILSTYCTVKMPRTDRRQSKKRPENRKRIIHTLLLICEWKTVQCSSLYSVPKNETLAIFSILYSCKSVAMIFSVQYPDDLSY